jgi:ribosomal protein S20
MPDEVNAGGAAAGGTGSGDGTAASGAGAGGGADTSALSDEQFLATTPAEGAEKKDAAAIVPAKTEAEIGAEKAGEEGLVKLDALEEGEPEWFANVKDAEAAAKARELWKANQEYAEHFKTPAELKEFFKDLPGGRDQVAALQTLSKEVTELDTAIESNTPESNLTVAERYLGMAPDKGIGLFRASAHHLAKANPEGWNQISGELVDATLKASGIGASLAVVSQAIKEMRDAATAQDGEAFGKAAQKLLGTPQAERQEDPAVVRARQEAQSAATERDKALTTTWQNSVNTNVSAVETMLRQDIGTALSKVLMESTKAETRKDLADKIIKEVDGQMGANAWLRSQIQSLVGSHQQMNLRASKEEFEKALQLSKDAAKPLISAAVRKVVSAWAKELAASNQAARDKAKGGAARQDVGATSAAKATGKGVLTEAMIRDENLDDLDILSNFSRR